MGRSRRRDEGAGPYTDLAREIEREVERVAADDTAGAAELEAVFDRLGRDERDRIALDAFRRLPAGEQWAVVEHLFDDEELRAALGVERERLAVAARMRIGPRKLDATDVPDGETLTLGLFAEKDVRGASLRGRLATNTARRLVLRGTDAPGDLRVVEDVFNPDGGYFVTADYDEASWRAERLSPHAVVTVGWIDGDGIVPELERGGRVDVEVDGALREGRLHLGYALLGDVEVFAIDP